MDTRELGMSWSRATAGEGDRRDLRGTGRCRSFASKRKKHRFMILLASQFWPIPSMSRRVINCAKLCLSHPFGRIKWIRQWAVERDTVLTSSTSAKIGKTARFNDICMN